MAGKENKTTKYALVVHSDVGKLAGFQSALTRNKYTAVIARDLPTALLAITQHIFDLAIVCARLTEPGDGWPLAGVIRLVWPNIPTVVLAPEENVLTFQAAINYGVSEIFTDTVPPEDVLKNLLGSGKKSREKRGQVQ